MHQRVARSLARFHFHPASFHTPGRGLPHHGALPNRVRPRLTLKQSRPSVPAPELPIPALRA